MTETSAAWIMLGAALSLTLAFAAFVVVQLRALSKPIEAGLGQAFREFATQWQRAFEAERLARIKNGRGVIGTHSKKPAYLAIVIKPRKVISVPRAAAQPFTVLRLGRPPRRCLLPNPASRGAGGAPQ